MSLRRLVARLTALGRSRGRRADIDASIEAHLADLEDEYRAGGLPPDEARAAARRRFGNVTLARERSVEAWRFRWLDELALDVRYGIRLLWRNRTVSFVVFAVMAVGIGCTTAIYSLVDACILRSYRPIDARWVVVRARVEHGRAYSHFFTTPELADVRGLTDVFEDAGAIAGTSFTLSEGAYPERVPGSYVTANVFQMLGTPPIAGRTYRRDEDRPGGPLVAVISDRLWQERFGRNRDLSALTVTLDGRVHAVIGVMPPHFDLWGSSVWVPFQLDPASTDRTRPRFWITALLRRGVSDARANARLRVLASTLARDYRDVRPDYAGMDLVVWNVHEAVIGGVRTAMFVLLAAVGLLLLIACANVANLLLARAVARGREMAVRTALGAGRRRLVRQMLTESLLLAGTGGSAGIALARGVLPLLVHLIPPEYLTTDADLVQVDAGIALMAAALSIAAGLLFGLVPALRAGGGAARTGLAVRGGTGDRRTRRLQHVLTGLEVALTVLVAIAASLMIRGYRAAAETALGFNPQSMLSFHVSLPATTYPDTARIGAFYNRLLERLNAQPGISGAAAVTDRPLGYRTVDFAVMDIAITGRAVHDAGPPARAVFRVVSPGYHTVLQSPILAGRDFTSADDAGRAPVAIVNDTMARRYWPNGGAVGQTLRLLARSGRDDPQTPRRHDLVRVIGVVADSKQVRVIEAPVRPEMFLPLQQFPEEARGTAILVRTAGDPSAAAGAVRAAVAGVDRDMPIFDVETMDDVVADAFGPKRLTLVLLLFFGVVAVGLASVGLYGIVSFAVEQRTRELSVRVAIGAQARAIVLLVLRDAAAVTAAGVVAGVAAALVLTRLMRSELSGVSATDPASFVAVSILLLAVTLAAAALPACRAARVDPLISLRAE